MFKKKEVLIGEKIETIIGASTSFKGDLNSEGAIRIDGGYEGSVETKGDVIIGEKGKAKATINARHILVAGELKGDIKCFGKLEINCTGKLIGDIDVESIVIEEGAVFKGNCTMKNVSGNKEKKAVKVEEAMA